MNKNTLYNNLFKWSSKISAYLILLLFIGLSFSLVRGAWPALHAAGSDFLFTNIWNPGRGQFGVMASVVGTLITSLLALIIGFPISLGIAIFLTELCPRSLRRILSMALEL